MTTCDLFPSFSLTDEWGREILFHADGRNYWRKNLDGAPWYPGEPTDEKISMGVFALALLRAHERRAEQHPEYATGRNTGDHKPRPWNTGE